MTTVTGCGCFWERWPQTHEPSFARAIVTGKEPHVGRLKGFHTRHTRPFLHARPASEARQSQKRIWQQADRRQKKVARYYLEPLC